MKYSIYVDIEYFKTKYFNSKDSHYVDSNGNHYYGDFANSNQIEILAVDNDTIGGCVNLAKLLDIYGYTFTSFSKASNIPYSTLTNINSNGIDNSIYQTIRKISETLGMPLDLMNHYLIARDIADQLSSTKKTPTPNLE
ncbi:MAG: hypothetical protein RR738_04900 [Anaerorhabdus sp.]|uniref:hypothetical protein n=1 Tax=Anaerorhabdus sp. TaxID=1872524 RepID=UPI002FC6FA12